MYDFNLLGNSMSFISKLRKHLYAGDCERVKDYLCAAYDTFNPSPETIKLHPCFDLIQDAIKFIKSKGWEVGSGSWGNIGCQLTIISPAGEYYHSKFKHTV